MIPVAFISDLMPKRRVARFPCRALAGSVVMDIRGGAFDVTSGEGKVGSGVGACRLYLGVGESPQWPRAQAGSMLLEVANVRD